MIGEVPLSGYAYAVGVLAAGFLSAWLAWYAWSARDAPGATSLAVLMVGVTIWNACTAVQLVVPIRPVLVALEVVVLGSVGLAVSGFLGLGLEYRGREQLLTHRTIALLAIEPVGIVLAAATNPWHGLVWRSFEPSGTALNTTTVEFGPLFWVHTAYSYFLLVAGMVLIGLLVIRWQSVYQRQAAAVFLGAFVPFVVNVASLSGGLSINAQPVAFAVTGLAAGWAIHRYQLIDLVPIAREQIVETLSDPVVVVDGSERITDVNPAAKKVLPTTDRDVVGRPATEAFERFPALRKVFENGSRSVDDLELQVDGGVRHFDVRVTPLTDERGDRRGSVVLLHDVTERETSRQELERRNEQLERFASVVSHDLRNPLSVAEGYLEMARESNDEDDFEAVEESLERMNAIIEDVLTMAQEGSRVEDLEDVALGTIAERAWEQVSTGDAALTIAGDVTIRADPDRLQRLLENCFRNSIEHGAGDGAGDSIPLTVTVGPIGTAEPGSLRSGEEYGFYVADDGVGIPEDRRTSVFDPGHSSSKDGTGLGLSIVQVIAEAHSWSVRATAAENGGARFDVTGASPVGESPSSPVAADGAQR